MEPRRSYAMDRNAILTIQFLSAGVRMKIDKRDDYGTTRPVKGLSVTLDIASVVSALLWPAVLLIVFLTYRKYLPDVDKWLAGNVKKIGIGSFSVELAVAKPYTPDWSEAPGRLDLRRKATAIQINDSSAMTFGNQLRQKGTGDYAEVDLGEGQEWLTSRLYIMAIIFERMKGIKAFVFLETSGGVRKRFVCWAEPRKVRWALAQRCPWLEQAYAEAYSTILSRRQAFIVSNDGTLGYNFQKDDPGPSIELLREFLQRIQAPLQPGAEGDWVLIDTTTQTHEHARWINSAALEEMLGKDSIHSALSAAELRSKSEFEQLRLFLSVPETFVAVTDEQLRLDYLVDRSVILEQMAKTPQ